AAAGPRVEDEVARRGELGDQRRGQMGLEFGWIAVDGAGVSPVATRRVRERADLVDMRANPAKRQHSLSCTTPFTEVLSRHAAMSQIYLRGAVLGTVLVVAACGATPGAGNAPRVSAPDPESYDPPQKRASGSLDPVRQRGREMRDVADLLDKAAEYKDAGQKTAAEHYFGLAELIVGEPALAALAPQFRAGAPPLITEPVKQ